jgi:aldose 1-epimerase
MQRTRPGQSAQAPLPAASFNMVPYSNRIRNGRFEFQGRTVQLADADRHAIHGALRKLPWIVESSDAASMTCTVTSADHPTTNWPWPIEATITHLVDGDRLTSTFKLTNQGDTDMPAGLGWHPYFVRQVNGSAATLTLPVTGVFPDANGDCLPDGPAVDLPGSLDFRHPRLLDSSQRIDCCLAGLDGDCVIHWQDAGIRLVMSASDNCRYLIAQGIESGTQVLRPGQTLEASMALRVVV